MYGAYWPMNCDREVGHAEVHDVLLRQRHAVGLRGRVELGERVQLLGRRHGVGVGLLLAAAEQLVGDGALAVEELDVELAAVELEVGVEVRAPAR